MPYIDEDLLTFNSSGWARIKCPVCINRVGSSGSGKNMGVSFEGGFYHCFRCKAYGIYKKTSNTEFVSYAEEPVQKTIECERPQDLRQLDSLGSTSLLYYNFLNSRRVPEQALHKLTWGVIGQEHDKWYMRGRIVLMIENDTSYIGWVARALADQASSGGWEPPKYMYNEGFRRGTSLFNQAALDSPGSDPILVVEGVFDALPYYPNAVACYGKPTSDQLKILSKSNRDIVIALDGDSWQESEMCSNQLYLLGKENDWLKLPNGEDPGSYDITSILNDKKSK